MGIRNFKQFLNLSGCLSNTLEDYDSIFIDIQSYLYKSIQYSFKSAESELMEEVCNFVIQHLYELFENIFSYPCFKDTVKVIISFDGESIPMKFPTQKQRRNVQVQGKNVYKIVLFGHNTISDQVSAYIIDTLTHYSDKMFAQHLNIPSTLEFYILGSDTKGEGEHKLFFLGSHLQCRQPVIASVDNDVFIIALAQLDKFDLIQIYKAKKNILTIPQHVDQFLAYDKQLCIVASLLFGNDFIPPVVNLTESNCPLIHEALQECDHEDMPYVFYTVLNKLKEANKIRYFVPPIIDESIVLEYWKNCFWVLDYYKHYKFPQKYMDNHLYDLFEKNHVMSALLDQDYARQTFKKAYGLYKKINLKSLSCNPKEVVFTNEQLKEYERFFPKTDTGSEKYHKIIITSRKLKK